MSEFPAEADPTAASQKLALIGAGVMGEAILAGLIQAGHDPASIVVTARRDERGTELASRYRITPSKENAAAVRQAGTVILVVKPQDLIPVLDEIAAELTPGTLVVSLAAGVSTEVIESRLPAGIPVVRAMPNTPALVGEGMAAISAGTLADPDHLAQVAALLGTTSRVVTVPEDEQDAVTAISGSGPAYVFLLAESMIEAGTKLGVPHETATDLVAQTLYGAAKLLRETGDDPAVLRERVTSPGGTTAAAVQRLEDHQLRAVLWAAMEAARDRSQSLSEAARRSVDS